MLRVFQIYKGEKIEIFPMNSVYTVLEMGSYEIVYTSDKIKSTTVFLEDMPISSSTVATDAKELRLSSFRYFENYFGYASLRLNSEIFLFNIKIQKLKLSEIEDIFIYLWKKEDKLFNVFFSKSTYELDFKKNGFELGQTSKLISFIEKYIATFETLYFSFKNLPHTVLRKVQRKEEYDSHKATTDTVDWILGNLDEIHFDDSFKGYYKSIKINNKYGVIDKIQTSENINSYNNYENQIVLGSFITILKKLNRLKSKISASIDIHSDSDEQYADFKDLKRIPFIRLFEDSTKLEKNLNRLFYKYQNLFKGAKPKLERPILTTVFSQKPHYKKAFILISNLNEYKFDLMGEFKLLNISKLSKLYEVYNLYLILESIKQKIRLDLFSIYASSERGDEIIEKILFDNSRYSICLFYEHKFFDVSKTSQEIGLRRIDTRKGRHYSPDYIIEITNKSDGQKKYYILDAKYSKLRDVKNKHLPDLIKKYIINTGIIGISNMKISSLVLVFPNDLGEKVIENDYFEPTIELIASKPGFENELTLFINKILEKNIPENLTINKNT